LNCPGGYSDIELEVLCRNCHAVEHGKIRPSTGWECVGEDDLGDLVGECDLCGTQLRYVFFLQHPKWDSIEVGTDCCDQLTGETYASAARKKRRRLLTFLDSRKWIFTPNNAEIQISNAKVEIIKNIESYIIVVNGRQGTGKYSRLETAMKHLLFIKESGQLSSFVNKTKT
jgi:hypothetical protein